MGYKDRKGSDKPTEIVMQDTETLLRYQRRGLPLSEAQKNHLRGLSYPVAEKKTGVHCTGHAETMHPAKARQILSSPAGQLALRLAVGHDLMTVYETSGRTEFDEAFVRECKQALSQAAQEVAKLTDANPWAATWRSFFDEMMNREKRLYAEFYNHAERAA